MPDDAALLNLVEQTPEYQPSLNGSAAPSAQPRLWEPPLPLDEVPVPEFPLPAFPFDIAQLCTSCANAWQVPVDLPGLLALGCLALACAGKLVVCLRQGWIEPINLYLAVAMPPGERKSPLFRTLTAPVYQYQKCQIELLRPVIAEAATKRKMLEKMLAKAMEKASKGGENAPREEVYRLGQKLEETIVPAEPRLVMDDTTPEALARSMAEQGGRMAILSTEGGIFDVMAGRYSASLNIDVYLKAHSGDPLVVDRIARGSNHIEHPALTMLLTVQPGVIAGLSTRPEFRARGLLGRFLYSIPRSIVGRRQVAPPPISDSGLSQWNSVLERLLGMAQGKESLVLALAPEAQEALKAFENWLEPQLGPGGDLEPLVDWANKLAGHVGRIAAILHLVRHAAQSEPWRQPIASATMVEAVSLGRYFIAHAHKAFDLMGANPHREQARRAVRWLARMRPALISRRDLMRALHLGSAETADEILTLLVGFQHFPLDGIPRFNVGASGGFFPSTDRSPALHCRPHHAAIPLVILEDAGRQPNRANLKLHHRHPALSGAVGFANTDVFNLHQLLIARKISNHLRIESE